MRIPSKIGEYLNKFNSFEFDFDAANISLGIQGRNKFFEISFENMKDILNENSVVKGKVVQPLIGIELDDGSIYFASKNNEIYKEAFKSSAITIKNLEVGEKITLMNGHKGVFLGSFYYLSLYGYEPDKLAYKSRYSYIKNENGNYIYFYSKDIYEVDGYDASYSDINKNALELDGRYGERRYFPTMSELRGYVKEQNLNLEN